LVRELLNEVRIAKYSFSRAGGRKWLGSVDGDMSRGEYDARTATENL